ncbi:ChaN family lipoprotein [Lutimaribacter marinistellae]|uniref:ChaN family lipoprotein n=1 Tax=Lutimaribacter marinistellae TaxID=1820329 RepID=A0ABV7TBL3_9RHOB
MKRITYLFSAVALYQAVLFGAAFASEPISADVIEAMQAADVVILGEVHDNPAHHRIQAEAVSAIDARAVVWEMLTEEGAARVNARVVSDPEKLREEIRWAELGWPPLSMYLPIFGAAPDALVFGALVPRPAARAAMETGPAVAFGADAARYGLTIPLPGDEQAEREADQMRAHCDALPVEILPQMVAIQRLRDAVLTRAILNALEETGGPVAVITGNGHARKDRGVPTFLARMRPGVRVFVLGQSEDGLIEGEYDVVLDSPAAEREDPCAAFAPSN